MFFKWRDALQTDLGRHRSRFSIFFLCFCCRRPLVNPQNAFALSIRPFFRICFAICRVVELSSCFLIFYFSAICNLVGWSVGRLWCLFLGCPTLFSAPFSVAFVWLVRCCRCRCRCYCRCYCRCRCCVVWSMRARLLPVSITASKSKRQPSPAAPLDNASLGPNPI